MTSSTLKQIMQQAEGLTADEQLSLITYLTERLKQNLFSKLDYKWGEIRGTAPHPLLEEDAQVYISRNRQESDAQRGSSVRKNA